MVGAEVGMEVAAEGVRSRGCGRAEVGLDPTQGEVHDGEAARGGVTLMSPRDYLWHPKDVGGEVFVFVVRIGVLEVALAPDQLLMVFVEGVGDVFEEDEAEEDVLLFRRVHVVAELVGGEPELGFEPEGGGRVFGRRRT